MNALTIWITIGLLLILSEFVIPGFVIFFFGVAAIIVGILQHFFAFMTMPVNVIATCLLGGILLLLCRRFMPNTMVGTKITEECETDLDNDGIIGAKVIVKSTITPEIPGKVELHGTLWNASAEQSIEAGRSVTVISKKNLTLKVKP